MGLPRTAVAAQVCPRCHLVHNIWSADDAISDSSFAHAGSSDEDGPARQAYRSEAAALRRQMAKIYATGVDTDDRLDCVRELGEHILRHLGPDSITAQNTPWRTVVLNKFACFGALVDDPSSSAHFSDVAKRWFRTVARAVIREVGRLHVGNSLTE
jgi:hypothetical protein